MTQALIWLLLIEFIGLLALPATFAFFPYLPDRGYSFSKVFGLLGGGFVVWFAGMLGLPFTAATSWILVVLLFFLLGGWLLRQPSLRRDFLTFFQERFTLIKIQETIFIFGYSILVNLRSYMPEIRGQEKFGDFAFLNSLVLHTNLPPADPWMSGYSINYYYFSHFLMALLTKMSGILPAAAFNLTIPLIFALTAAASFGLLYNMVMAARGGNIDWRMAGLAGALASIGVCFLGNPESARQVLFPSSGQSAFYNWWSPSRVIYDYMPQPIGNGVFGYRLSETITEFPFFSFLLADMHPHVMALPFALLVTAAAFNLLIAPAKTALLNLRTGAGWYYFFWLSLIVGALYFLNTWDYPTYLALIAAAALLREIRVGGEELSNPGQENSLPGTILLGDPVTVKEATGRRFWRWMGFTLKLVAGSLILYIPFHLTFVSLIGDNSIPDALNVPVLSSLAKTFLVVAWDRTPFLVQTIVQENGEVAQRWGYLMVFGFFLFPIVSLLVLKLTPYFRNPYAYLDDEEINPPDTSYQPFTTGFFIAVTGLVVLLMSEIMGFLHFNPLFTLIVGLLSVPVTAAGGGILAYEYLARVRHLRPIRELVVLTFVTAAAMTLLGWTLHFELYGPLLILFVLSVLLTVFELRKFSNNSGNTAEFVLSVVDQFAFLLVLFPALITFAIEIVFLRDIFNARINTIFKFYYQSWIFYALASAYAVWRVSAWGWKLAPFNVYREGYQQEGKFVPEALTSRPSFFLRHRASLQLGGAGAGTGLGNLAFNVLQPISASPTLDTKLEKFEQDEEAEAAEAYNHKNRFWPGWRWPWAFVMSLLLLAGLIYPFFSSYEKSGHYRDRLGINGEQWISQMYPENYAAIKWLREQAAANPDFEGPLLETTGGDWVDYNLVGTFSGFSDLIGWAGHELQWRGGKTSTRDEVTERLQAVDTIYSSLDINQAETLLKKYKIKFVLVGSFETGARDAGLNQKKNYSSQALLKFGQFMKPVFQQNGVTIYSF